jgi:hypothetical protein
MDASLTGTHDIDGTVLLWGRQDGKNLDNSNTEQSIANGFTRSSFARSPWDARQAATLLAREPFETARSRNGLSVRLSVSPDGLFDFGSFIWGNSACQPYDSRTCGRME